MLPDFIPIFRYVEVSLKGKICKYKVTCKGVLPHKV